ncbi:MAG: hypothetical protein R3E67_08355 [Pseudomonadales bacterium]
MAGSFYTNLVAVVFTSNPRIIARHCPASDFAHDIQPYIFVSPIVQVRLLVDTAPAGFGVVDGLAHRLFAVLLRLVEPDLLAADRCVDAG